MRKKNTIYILILFIYLTAIVSYTESKSKKKKPNTASCTAEFLWEALSAASQGNESAAKFLQTSVHKLGFTNEGIQAGSVAARWQSLIKMEDSRRIFALLQQFGATNLTNCKDCKSTTKSSSVTFSTETSLPGKNEFDENQRKIHSKPKARKKLRFLIKAINKLFESFALPQDLIETKLRNRKLKRMINLYTKRDLQCTEITQNEIKNDKFFSVKKKKKKKGKQTTVDFIEICLLMIDELLKQQICEAVPSKYITTFRNVQENYKTDNEISKIVTVPVP